MTPAELKTYRESLGLTLQWLADNSNVKLRTAQYWESGRMSVPLDVSERLSKLDQQFSKAADYAVQIAHENVTAQDSMPDNVVLYRYRTEDELWQARPDMQGLPVTSHAALLNRCRLALEADGFIVRIEYAT